MAPPDAGPAPAGPAGTRLAALTALDWECVDADTRYLTHAIHRYPSKFIPQVARYLIESVCPPGDLVLDPFAGSGTTLLEARLTGRAALGFDRNPLALLIAQAKCAPPPEDPDALRRLVADLRPRIAGLRNAGPPPDHPERFPNEALWFTPAVRAELDAIAATVRAVEDPGARRLAAVALSDVVRTVSNADPRFGNLVVARRRTARADTFERFTRRLIAGFDASIELARWFRRTGGPCPPAHVMPADARALPLADASVAAVVTHPPYLASVPYAEYQRLSLNWLRTRLAGAIPFFELGEALPSRLDGALIGGRRRRDDALARYEAGMAQVFAELGRVLRPGALAAIVIGNPRFRGETVPLDALFVRQAAAAGMRLELQIRRGKYKTTMGKLREEFVQVYRRR